MDARIHRALGNLEETGDHCVGHEGPEGRELGEGLLVLPFRPGEAAEKGLAPRPLRFLDEAALEEAEGGPGAIPAKDQALEATAFDLEEAPRLGETGRDPGFGQPREGGGEARLPVPGLPGALDEEVEDPVVPRAPVATGGRPGRPSPRGGEELAFLLDGLLDIEAEGALADRLAFLLPASASPIALRQEAETRRHIGLEAGAALLVAVEEGGYPFAPEEEGIGGRIDILETEAARIPIEDLGQPGQEGFPPPAFSLPPAPGSLQTEFLHGRPLGKSTSRSRARREEGAGQVRLLPI